MRDTLEAGLSRLAGEDPGLKGLLEGREAVVLLGLIKYIEEIERFNAIYGLIRVQNRRELIIKHILDSLAPRGLLEGLLGRGNVPGPGGDRPLGSRSGEAPPSRPEIADIGSGAGLPGIPLAITMPHCRFTLIERMGRRAGFLRNTLAVLGLPNAVVEEGEMERVPPARFDLLTFRAFRPLDPGILRDLFRLLKSGGIIAACKGRGEKIASEMAAVEKLTGPWEAVPLRVPFLEETRHLLIIRPPPGRT